MDPLAALLSERPPQQLSASELRSRIALLEDAARAYRAELESRNTRLDALPDEMQQVIFGQLCNALDPRSAVDYSSASKALRELMQRVGEGAGKSPLQQLKEENAAAAALGRKAEVRSCNTEQWAEVRSCKALREAKQIVWSYKGLSTTDLVTLGKLIPVLPALEELILVEAEPFVSDGVRRLVEGLGVGALPAVTRFVLNMGLGVAGALERAVHARDRGRALPRLLYLDLDYRGRALPRLMHLDLDDTALPDCGFWLQLTLARAGAGLSGEARKELKTLAEAGRWAARAADIEVLAAALSVEV